MTTEDAAIALELLRRTVRRIGAGVIEGSDSHIVFLTQLRAVADVIEAALGVLEAGQGVAAELPAAE